MLKRFAFLILMVAAVAATASEAAAWYPFYGDRTPSYLGGSSSYYYSYSYAPAPVQPQVYTANYPPADEQGVQNYAQPTAQYQSPCTCVGARWYPFYGYR